MHTNSTFFAVALKKILIHVDLYLHFLKSGSISLVTVLWELFDVIFKNNSPKSFSLPFHQVVRGTKIPGTL